MRIAVLVALFVGSWLCVMAWTGRVSAQDEAGSPSAAVSDVAAPEAARTGALAERISLALPAAPMGLPVPLTIVSALAAAYDVLGPGWQMPLSYVRRSRELDGRVPVRSYDFSFEDVELSIAGNSSSLRVAGVQGSLIKYRPLVVGDVHELVYDEKDRVFRAHDSSGPVFVFRQHEEVDDDELWLLSEILDGTGMHQVRLEYLVDSVSVSDDGPSAQEIVLDTIRYGFAHDFLSAGAIVAD